MSNERGLANSDWENFSSRWAENTIDQIHDASKLEKQIAEAKQGILPDDFDPAVDTHHPALSPEMIFAARAAARAKGGK